MTRSAYGDRAKRGSATCASAVAAPQLWRDRLGSRGARLHERGFPRGAPLDLRCRNRRVPALGFHKGARLPLAGVHGAGQPLPSRAARKEDRFHRDDVAHYRAWLALCLICFWLPFSSSLTVSTLLLGETGRQGSCLPSGVRAE